MVGELLDNSQPKSCFIGIESSWIYINDGVTKGSILAHLLFWIFINDIVNDLKSYIWLFADDTRQGWRYKREISKMKKDKGTNNYLQNTTQKTKYRVTQSTLITGCSRKVSGSCSPRGIRLTETSVSYLVKRLACLLQSFRES